MKIALFGLGLLVLLGSPASSQVDPLCAAGRGSGY